MAKACVEASMITRLGGCRARYASSWAVRIRRASTISQSSPLRTQICDSLPPQSIATWSMAGLLRLRLERVKSCSPIIGDYVAIEASHFIQSSAPHDQAPPVLKPPAHQDSPERNDADGRLDRRDELRR